MYDELIKRLRATYEADDITNQGILLEAADVRPVVRGRWEHISFMTVKCSNCQEYFHELEGDNFCTNCGAMMEES